MRFSVFLVGRSSGAHEDSMVIDSLVDHAMKAEAWGYDAVFLPDHHFTGYAPMASDPFMFACYLAGGLRRVYFGFSVTTVPLHNPVRLVERINLLDQFTKGRLLVGVGSGTTPEEMIGFGVNFQDAPRVAAENMEIAERLWAKAMDDEPVIFDTGHYKGAVVQRIVPAPYRRPHAQLMTVALRDSSIARAAETASPAFIPAFTPPIIANNEPFTHVKAHFTKYRDALLAAGHSDEAVAEALGWTTHTYQCVHVAESDDQAREELQTILEAYQGAIEREHAYNKRAEAISGVDLRDPPNALSEEWIRTWCLWGSPDTVAEELQKYADLGIGNTLMGFTTGPLTAKRQRLGNRSMKLFAERVMPRFKGGPGA